MSPNFLDLPTYQTDALPEHCNPVRESSEHAQLHQSFWGKPLNAQSFSLEADGVTVKHHYLADAHLVPKEVAAVTGSRLLILSEYSSLYDTILKVHQHLPWAGVLIQGNPGISESFGLLRSSWPTFNDRKIVKSGLPWDSIRHLVGYSGVLLQTVVAYVLQISWLLMYFYIISTT